MQQSMQISLLCSTEHKEENMIFINSPFAILDEAFRSLYPDKKYKACIEPSIKDDEGNRVFGFTQFSKGETPVIAISAELSITDATRYSRMNWLMWQQAREQATEKDGTRSSRGYSMSTTG